MNKIQVDMYAVGLGAAILVQYRLEDGKVVRVLADGGMGHGGYPVDGVHDRIADAFTSFGDDESRIDLIIGTHYDGDHLKGLVPIAEDDSLQIGEVWLPPIRDDSDEVPGHISEDSGFLAHKFFEDPTEQSLLHYLQSKFKEIQDLDAAERHALGALSEAAERSGVRGEFPMYHDVEREHRAQMTGERLETVTAFLKFFEREEAHAASSARMDAGHGAAEFDSSNPHISRIAYEARTWRERAPDDMERFTEILAGIRPGRMRLLPAILANVRKSTAANAITAVHLQKLVAALRNRASPVRPKCQYIKAGNPVRYAWDDRRSRFIARNSRTPSALSLQLLGPSDTLVNRFRDRLPVGTYAEALAFRREPIPRESITASNQLSYILVLEAHEQRVLITGDAGCYDFRDDTGTYYSSLIRALSPLHVVQIAHHAGHNYDFYNCLLEADLPAQREQSFLLLSHDYHDVSRPSDAFRRFMAQMRADGDDLTLLFTSEPTLAKVRDYDELIAPLVPSGSSKKSGDARLVYGGRRAEWSVARHVVAV